MGEDPGIADLISKRGWIHVDYDRSLWIPCPPGFRADMAKEEWSRGFATIWWEATGLKFGDREVGGLQKTLEYLHDNIYGRQPCHLVLIHLPDARMMPLPVCFGIWQSFGERESQLRTLAHTDDPAAVEKPIVEAVTTEKLGTGLKCLYYQRKGEGNGLLGALNYAWRSEDYETDLRVFTVSPDLGRLQGAVPDIDALTNEISFVPASGV